MKKLDFRKIFKYQTAFILAALLLIGLFVRTFHLSNVSLYGDELTILLDANSLLHTAHDQTGQLLPLTFSMGAGRPAGYVYGSIPFVAIFGANEWGVRALSLLSGLLLIGLIFLLGKRLENQKLGLIAAGLITFSFWDINLSRGGFEAHFALMLSVLGILGLFYATKKSWWLLISAICFGLTFHTYPTYKLVLPLLFVGLAVIYAKETKQLFKRSKYTFISALGILVLLGGLAIAQTFVGGSEARFLSINIFSDNQINETITQKINEERSTTSLPSGIAALFHNRPLEYAKVLGHNYFDNFSWNFLFINGDKNPRHNMSTMGFFYFIEILTIGFGIFMLATKKRWKTLSLLLTWVLVSPLATALVDTPHGLRSAFMLPALVLLSAYGIYYLVSLNKKLSVAFGGIILAAFILQFIYFGEKLYFLAPNSFGRFWAEEGKNAALLAEVNKASYDYVIVSDKIDSIEYAYPAYAKVDPQDVINQHPKNDMFMSHTGFKKFDNVYIGNVSAGDIKMDRELSQKTILYIGQAGDKESFSNYESIKGCDRNDQLIMAKFH